MITTVVADGKNEYEFIDLLKKRAQNSDKNVVPIVSEIIENVAENGDKAVKEYTVKFDGKAPEKVEITSDEIDSLIEKCDKDYLETIKKAAANIADFHKRQVQQSWLTTKNNGVMMGQRIRGLKRVGIYVPGGTAAYPSSVLMNAVPAKIAGVEEIIMCTPPQKDGTPNPNIIAAAKVAGVDRIFLMGGAQAVAALAYGTESVPKVDKSANPKFLAADLMIQAEHDRLASAILLTDCEELAKETETELEKQMTALSRKDIIRSSVDNFGAVIVCSDMSQAIEFANELAPEHLEVCCENPMEYVGKLDNAGSVFLGNYSPEPLGDYFAGPNHVLPTSGTARFFSPLSVDSFVKKSSFIYYTEDALRKDAEDVVRFAETEGLTAHANSIKVRFDMK